MSEQSVNEAAPLPIAKAPRTAVPWLAVVLVTLTIVWTATMFVSLRWRFLDQFVAGAHHGHIGGDFYQTPRGFLNLKAGNNILFTEIVGYGPYATPYLNHPFLAVAVGPWTAPFLPKTAYLTFVTVSLLMLAASGWCLASAFENPAQKAFAYFAIFCSFPTYLMLWNAQMHVFLVLAIALILAGLLHLAKNSTPDDQNVRWIQAGVLISLLSKPAALLMLPVLFALPEIRRKLMAPVVIYAVVSLLFLLLPRLNPGGYNGQHWLRLLESSASPTRVDYLVYPVENDNSSDFEVYSVHRLLIPLFGGPVPSLAYRFPLPLILILSLTPLVLSDRDRRLRVAVATVGLCILSHFICYFLVYEYHYTTMLPLLPALLWLWRSEETPLRRRLLLASFVASMTVLLPTPNFLVGTDIARMWLPCALMRLVPAVAAFVLLAAYGLTLTWADVRDRLSELMPEIVRQIHEEWWPAVVIGGSLLAVVAAAFWAAPARLRKVPAQWTRGDWIANLSDVVSRPGIAPRVEADIRLDLAHRCIDEDPMLAERQCETAHRLVPLDADVSLEVADYYLLTRKLDAASKLLDGIRRADLTPKKQEYYSQLRKALEAASEADNNKASTQSPTP